MSEQHPAPPFDRCRLGVEELRWTCDPARFPFADTSSIDDCPIEIIGQPRAMAALSLGLELRAEGYNVFVAGEVGTGRSTAVRRIFSRLDLDDETPPDLVYVHDFQDQDRPRLLTFPAGEGRRFKDGMERAVRHLQALLPQVFDSEAYRARRARLVESAKAEHRLRVKEFEAEATTAGFALAQVQMGALVRPELVPLVEGEPVSLDDLHDAVEEGGFDREQFETLRKNHERLTIDLGSVTKAVRSIQRQLRDEIAALDREIADEPIRDAVEELRGSFEQEDVHDYLDQATSNVLDRVQLFRTLVENEHDENGDGDGDGDGELESILVPYRVNLLVDNTSSTGRPIVWESSPTFRNLFGTIERIPDPSGRTETDHTRIKPGSVVRANGGFLVIDAMDLLVEGGVWPALKRTLRTGELEIQSYDARHPELGSSLQPQPVPLDLKVVLIGTRQIYRSLFALDEDFVKIFKVKAEFALHTSRSELELGNYACFVRKKVRDDDLPHFTAAAVSAVVEQGARRAGRRDRLTTQFNQIADLVRESGYWARRAGAELVSTGHVDQALAEQKYRRDLVEEVLRERITGGSVLIELEGERVGQVNGLVVLDVGDHRFGQPSRITATSGMGRTGILDIERESEMSGPIHAKGVLILAGFLRDRFAQDHPLSLAASLCFEQSYGLVEGDSASCAELCALLSSLSGVPLRQGIAITGSVNQMGEIQPIGGVNEKVEGFFDLCKERGPGPGRGVIVPRRNLEDLMLRADVIEAVRSGAFSVWAISAVEEAVEILTGVRAGSRDRDRAYPEDTVFGRVDRRLATFAAEMRAYGRET